MVSTIRNGTNVPKRAEIDNAMSLYFPKPGYAVTVPERDKCTTLKIMKHSIFKYIFP